MTSLKEEANRKTIKNGTETQSKFGVRHMKLKRWAIQAQQNMGKFRWFIW